VQEDSEPLAPSAAMGRDSRGQRGEPTFVKWLAALDDFRNWVTLGFQPAKRNENL